jgi:hypothetical protein
MKKYLICLMLLCSPLISKMHQSSNPVEFKYTKKELKEISKWKNKSLDDLTEDALKGDPSALYMIGLGFLFGTNGSTIDVKAANIYFTYSASLGFAPALDKLKHMYINDNPNIFLALVYHNLTSSFNHSEMVVPYLEIRDNFVQNFGLKMTEEVEKIASIKKDKIFKNIDKLEKAKDKNKAMIEVMMSENITRNDYVYNEKYWLQFFKK